MSSIDYTNLESMLSGFNNIIQFQGSGPNPVVPAPLILTGAQNRSGLSAIRAGATILEKIQQIGGNIATMPSGAPNIDAQAYTIIAEVILNEILQNMIITVVLNPGITISAAGANAGGPVVSVGVTTTYGSGYGVVQ